MKDLNAWRRHAHRDCCGSEPKPEPKTEAETYFAALDVVQCDCLAPAGPLPVARRRDGLLPRVRAWLSRVLARVIGGNSPIDAFNVCRNGHVIPEPGSTWCDRCDSAEGREALAAVAAQLDRLARALRRPGDPGS